MQTHTRRTALSAAASLTAGAITGLAAHLLGASTEATLLAGIGGAALGGALRQLQADRAESASERLARLVLATEGAQVGLWHWDLRTDRVLLNARAEQLLGLQPAKVHPVGAWLRAVAGDGWPALEDQLRAFARGPQAAPFEQTTSRPTGASMPRSISLRAARGGPSSAPELAGSVKDVTVATRREHELQLNTWRDPLTGLGNRHLLIHQADTVMADQRRSSGHRAAIISLNVDRFSRINELFGAESADRLLRRLGARLERGLRPDDTLSRLGADRFGLLAVDRSPEELEALARGLLLLVREGGPEDPHDLSACAGLAVADPSSANATDLLLDADLALQAAKQAGPGSVAAFTPALRAARRARLEIEQELPYAAARGELSMVYQPIVDLADQRIHGFEALVRWRRGDRFIPPDVFIKVAEETGQIVSLTYWILEEVSRTLAAWRAQAGGQDLWVHVNFSGRHFSEADVLHCIRSTISRFDLPAEAIHIELTETSMLRQAGGVDDALRQLRDAGHHLHLDDFGTGYASVAYLNRWRFDGIKIDRSFINQLDDGLQRNMVRGIVQMAQGLGLHVIAEGVETDAQRACLTELGCDAAQGYLFSRPVPAAEAWGLVRAQVELEPTTPRPRMRVVR